METMTITFVLGALSGLFLLGMVYAFVGVLKIQKEIKNIQGDLRHLNKQINTMDHEIHRRITTIEEQAHRRMDEMLRDLDKINEQTHLIIGENAKEVHGRIDEILRGLEQQRQDEVRRSNDDYQNLRKMLDDTNRYVDKRVDNANTTAVQYIDKKIENTVDALCVRMDIAIESAIEESQIQQEELIKS
jgi:seryl-tRNA synthetase